MKSVYNPAVQKTDIESKIIVALERISEVFRVILWNENNKYHLSPIQIQIMIFLLFHRSHQRTVTGLAKEFNLTKATVSDAIRSLESKDLVTKRKSASDMRVFVLTLTSRGVEVARKVALFSNDLREPFSNLDKADKVSFLKILLWVLHEFQKEEIITSPRMCPVCANFQIEQVNGNRFYCNRRDVYIEDHDLRIDCSKYEERESVNEDILHFFV